MVKSNDENDLTHIGPGIRGTPEMSNLSTTGLFKILFDQARQLRANQNEQAQPMMEALIRLQNRVSVERAHNARSHEDTQFKLSVLAAEHNRALHEKSLLEGNVMTDERTGIANLRGVREEIRWAIEQRDKGVIQTFSVVKVDANGLKRMNDDFSEAAGNSYIEGIARALTDSCRETDKCGRTGGDEFVIVAMNVPESAHENVLTRIDDQTYNTWVTIPETNQQVQVSVTAGAYEANPGDSVDAILAGADKAYKVNKANSPFTRETFRHTFRDIPTPPGAEPASP